jgi:hypothetical protein
MGYQDKYAAGPINSRRVWCSEACRDAKQPPLLAPETSGAKTCEHGKRHHCADCDVARAICDIARAIAAQRPAPQPEPKALHIEAAKPAEAKCDCARDTHSGPVLLRYLPPQAKGGPAGAWACEECMLWWEQRAATLTFPSVGTPYAGPERLPAPRLARDEMVESDCWEDA